jgi:hypothetical protein
MNTCPIFTTLTIPFSRFFSEVTEVTGKNTHIRNRRYIHGRARGPSIICVIFNVSSSSDGQPVTKDP